MFFGIGRRMVKEFGTERVEIIPDLSSVQQAFSRINEPWDDAFFISLHGGPDIAKRRALPYEVTDIPALLQRYGKMGILTDRENNPGVIAKVLQSAIRLCPAFTSASASAGCNPQSEILMYVCEHLGYPDEKIISGTIEELAGRSFADPNVVILKESGARSQKSELRLGLREEDIVHERGLITKDEVRAVTLHKLRLPGKGVFWDVGAGSGSVSLEAARLSPGLRIFTIEKDPKRSGDIAENIQRFFTKNIELVNKAAPEALADLPAPDRVFIGGSGGSLGDIVKIVSSVMTSGIVVINAATLETLHEAMASLEAHGFSVDVSEISVSRSKVIAGKRLMSALNPVFVVKGERS
jgi:precorrin-6Y C5,15-methyltransferase (decarboxylating)